MNVMISPAKSVARFALVFVLLAAGTAPQVAENADWPRAVELPEGRIVIYQPEPESFEGNNIAARAAVSVTLANSDAPVFGVVWLSARVETDRDERTVTVLDIDVTRVRFPDTTPEQEESLADILEAQMPQWELVLSLDRLLASLAILEQSRAAAQNLGAEPPEILFVTEPTVLVSIDGEPILQPVEDGAGVMRVVNTPFTILLATDGDYFLFAAEDQWYEASSLGGPWGRATSVPGPISALAPVAGPDLLDAPDDEPGPPGPAPAILVATTPTELIVTEGALEYTPISGTDLLYVTNSESDILLEIGSQRHFIVLSGRWFASSSLDGPWVHVPPGDLPTTMADIPAESEMGYLLLSVPGTPESDEAVLDHQIPQTSAIRRDQATLEVTYDGDPWFEPIDGTAMEYAINTDVSVIRVGPLYYACSEGVWFVAGSAEGPWRVADDIPDEIYTIPPSVSVHNVTYVHVYESTPTVVYVGYYPGYTHSYVYAGTVVYGTGYYYTPWYGSVYYPHHATWGFHVRYNPWYGWGVGFSYSTGPFTFAVGWGGGYPGHHGYWGPVGHRGYHAGYHRGWHDGYRAGAGAGYRAGFRAGTNLDNTRNNIYDRPQNRARNVDRTATRERIQPGVAAGASNNVFSDRNGEVFRRGQNEWEGRTDRQWEPTRPAGAGAGAAAGAGSRAPDRDQLNRSLQSRDRGASRSRSFQRSRSGARGGGRRR